MFIGELIMIKTIQKRECLIVTGGGFCWADLEAIKHMGENRNQDVSCYNKSGEEVDSWKSRDWNGAIWYCCTCGRRGPFPYMSMNNRVYDCVNNKELDISPTIFDGKKRLIASIR